jgi:AcrR family transcriptional regulator
MYYDLSLKPITNSTKIRILEVAIELFSKNGYNGSSIRDITKEVGIKESSLYKHFKNKEEILDTIFSNFQLQTDTLLPPMEMLDQIAKTMSLKQFLERGIENFLAHINNQTVQQIWRIMYIELFRHSKAQNIYHNGIMKRTIDCLELVFEKMIQQGKMAAIHPRTMATEYQHASISLILEYNMLLNEGKSTEEIMEKINNHVEFFSLLASKGAASNEYSRNAENN